MNPNTQPSGSARYFFLAFAVAFLGFSLMFLALANLGFARPAAVPAPIQEDAYSPSPEDSITVLAMGTAEKGGIPEIFMLVRVNPITGEVPFTVFPPQTMITNNGRLEPLSEVYKYGGAQYTKEKLAEELGIAADRYIRVDRAGFITAADAVGSIEYTLAEDFTVWQLGAEMTLQAGMQLLDGRRLAAILTSAAGGDARAQRAGELIASFINQRIDIFKTVAADGVFEKIINIADSDITYLDYHIRKDAGEYLARLDYGIAVYIRADFTDESSFILADTFKAKIAERFG
ncbi:MAG: LCP family protein [Oscillospiraceae bacterium]|nr:LCP family protein [Oscillospiraceae bacterium]